MDDIARKIRDLREDHDILQDQMAAILNCNRGSVSNYENGRNLPMDVLIAYCRYFNVSADWLLRTNIPSVTAIYNEEVNSILSDCTSSEIENLIGVMRDMKKAIHSAKHSGKD